ncbi:MAG: LysR family transcriptional regulator [Pseudorhodoplanes sp.]|nr:HTH-type transcriptional regulator GltR [Pseudorhodoplanes sp.]MBW7948828.1 LysR family transcriptional regulator [Pseudorhodoplanes sp.]MCL4713099.1 LysR family transcriptional regulator [Pseudorhodoplanes sp.]GIK81819.1 MAG: transcriptional regulator [Alphaproteobacteria bacterium]
MRGDRFDWDDLRYFLAVARAGRLTAAAVRLQQNHTTVSRRIEALEKALAAPLFDRGPQGYRLTEFGQRLLATAEMVESATLAAPTNIRGSKPPVSGSVRIGAPDGFGTFFLAPRLGQLCRDFPQLDPELVTMPRLFSLSKREADIAISLNRPVEGRLFARKITDYELGLYATKSYLSGKPAIRGVADLHGHRLIGYVDDYIFTPELNYLPLILPGLTAQIRSSNLVAQYNATLAGAGVCVLPLFMAGREPRLVPVLADKVRLVRTFWLVTHADLHSLPQIRAISDFIAREVKAARALFLDDGNRSARRER